MTFAPLSQGLRRDTLTLTLFGQGSKLVYTRQFVPSPPTLKLRTSPDVVGSVRRSRRAKTAKNAPCFAPSGCVPGLCFKVTFLATASTRSATPTPLQAGSSLIQLPLRRDRLTGLFLYARPYYRAVRLKLSAICHIDSLL